MRLRRRFLFALAGLLCAVLVILPAAAISETVPPIEAVNVPAMGIYKESHYWSPAQATITAGGTVTIANPGEVPHGVEWVSGPATPACSGVPVGTTVAASEAKWSGTCSFSQPGTYVFYCTVHHAEMTARITVDAAGESTPTTTTPPPPGQTGGAGAAPGAGGSPAGGPPGARSPLAGTAASAVRVPSHQRGRSVHGSVDISSAGLGGRLEVDLLAGGASLARARSSARVRVGRLLRPALHAGLAGFSVPLGARGRAALRRHGHIALSVRLVISPMTGAAVTITREVLLRR